MRPLEIFIPFLLSTYLLWSHPRSFVIRLIPSAALAVVLVHLMVEGYRWQMIPVYSLTTILLAASLVKIQSTTDGKPIVSFDSLARKAGMSVSGFHHHFKAVTAMSLLQFQKRLRLQEARPLMLGNGLDAASAASRVEYHNAAHFCREYKSLYSLPPMRDMERLRGTISLWLISCVLLLCEMGNS